MTMSSVACVTINDVIVIVGITEARLQISSGISEWTRYTTSTKGWEVHS